MFGRGKKHAEPRADLRCSFCNKGQQHVRKLIAGPLVYICDGCVDVCVGIIADDRRADDDSTNDVVVADAKPTTKAWPVSDAWCAFCARVANLETALLIENRTLLCEPCVQAIALAASEAHREHESKE